MLNNEYKFYNKDDSHARFFLLRMLFKHIELFNLWKKSSNSSIVNGKPESYLYEITLELLDEIQRLEPAVKIKSYKKVAGTFAISVSNLAKVLSPKEPLAKFYFYLYVLHRKLLESLANSSPSINYNQAADLHFIANEIIDKVYSFDNYIKALLYKKEISKLRESFVLNNDNT